MILINLLPHREAARKRRRETFYATLGLSAVLGGLIAVTAFLWFQAQISNQQSKNALLKTEITKLETEIKEISTLQAEIAVWRARKATATCPSTCSTSWSGSCRTGSTSPA